MAETTEPTPDELRHRITTCPAGKVGWKQFEVTALDILTRLFCPPLPRPTAQVRTIFGTARRDAFFSNRVSDINSIWGLLRHDHQAKLIPVEFKNYREQVGPEEVVQLHSYLRPHMGNLAIMCTNKPPSRNAELQRNTFFSDYSKVIVFITTTQLLEMLDIKERGDDPAVFVADCIDEVLMKHQ